MAVEGASSNSTKINGIIIDETFEIDVGLTEISGANWKVNTTHFIEDKVKIAKNLKSCTNISCI